MRTEEKSFLTDPKLKVLKVNFFPSFFSERPFPLINNFKSLVLEEIESVGFEANIISETQQVVTTSLQQSEEIDLQIGGNDVFCLFEYC